MKQTNLRTGYVREVCRRPCFVSQLDLMTGCVYVSLFCSSADVLERELLRIIKLKTNISDDADDACMMMLLLTDCFHGTIRGAKVAQVSQYKF